MVLIDEFSTGIDAKMKRDMWGTLRNVAVGKAIVITTRELSRPLLPAYIVVTPLSRFHGGSIRTSEQSWYPGEEDAR